MRSFYVYASGAAILIIIGLIASLFNHKAHFLIWLIEWRYPLADHFFYYVTLLGEEHAFVFFGILLWIRSWKKMLAIPILGLIVMLVSFLLKQFFKHERPSVYLDSINWDGAGAVLGYHMIGGYQSFPSGHAMAAWAIFTFMAAYVNKTWFSILSLVLAVAASLSRVYLMAHFLQDVVVGAMVGFSLGYGVYYLHVRWLRKNENQKKNMALPETVIHNASVNASEE